MSLLYRYQSLLYKLFLCLATVAVIVYLLPRGGSFQYEIQAGKPWQYETLLAPYDFPIQKTADELKEEKAQLAASIPRYFSVAEQVSAEVTRQYESYVAALPIDASLSGVFVNCRTMIEQLYSIGIVASTQRPWIGESIALVQGTRQSSVALESLYLVDDARDLISVELNSLG